MHKTKIVVVVTIVALLSITSRAAYSQSPDADGHKFEVGGQFSVLNSVMARDVRVTAVQCVTAPCDPILTSSASRKIQPGFGGRFGYNLTDNLALEAEVNFFPKASSFDQPREFNDGHLLQGLFGVKAGKRFEKIGVFGKARPGFSYASKGDLRIKAGACITVLLPPVGFPVGCFEPISRNSLAFDLGGVVELYPSKRTLIRLDFGNTIIRQGQRNVTAVVNPAPGSFSLSSLLVVGVPAETTHNLQVSVGVGFRF